MLFRFLRKALLVFVGLYAFPSVAHKPLLWNVPVDSSSFYGRKAYLVELQAKLTGGPVVVTGLSGVGKSMLTFAYAKTQAHKYRVVWVFDASKEIGEQMIEFANKLHGIEHNGKLGNFSKKEEASHYMKTCLRTCAFSWLLIFDGASSFADMKDVVPETHNAQGKHVLVSSLSDKGEGGILRLDALTDSEAHTLLSHYLKDVPAQDIARLAKVLENHPLAMIQAANYIKSTPGMGVEAYIVFFTKRKKDFWASEAKALQGQPLLFTAIKMSIDKLKSASPEDYALLVALCMLSTHNIEQSLVEKAYVQLTQGDMGGFGKIVDVALISKADTNAYMIHDYVRDVVLATANEETLQKAASLDADVFLALFPEKVEDCVGVFEKNPALVDHLKVLMTHIDLMKKNDAFALGVRLFYYADAVLRDYTNATLWSNQLEKLFETGKIEDPYLKAVFKSYYGDTRVMTDGIDVSLAQYRQAAPFFEQADPEKARSEHVMFLANNLGYFLHYKGEIDEATQCLERAKVLLGDQKDIFPQSAIDELEISLAIDTGHFKDAVRVADRELAMLEADPVFKRVTGHFVKSLKACALLKQAQVEASLQNHEEAKVLFKQALAVAKDSYKDAVESSDGRTDEEVVARTLLYLSQAQSALGDGKEAQENAVKAIRICKKHYPNEMSHPRQAVAHMALGDALMVQKRVKEALAEYRKAEEVFNRISSRKAYDDMSELYHKIVIAYIAMKDQMNTRRYALKHLDIYPVDHPRFVDIRHREVAAGY